MKTSPLLPIEQDPAFLRAVQIGGELTTAVQGIRGNLELSELAMARQVVAKYDAAMAERTNLWNDLQARRDARMQELQALLPFGPGIAPGTSAADAAVLQTAFRANVDRARSADVPQLRGMLADALRFGDEMARRAVYTVAADQGREGLVWDQLQAEDPELAPIAREIGQLSAQINRTDPTAAMWERKGWWPIDRPDEVFTLPALEDRALAPAGA